MNTLLTIIVMGIPFFIGFELGMFVIRGNKVKCEECKHVIEKKDTQKVKRTVVWTNAGGISRSIFIEYYCSICKKPYDRTYEHYDRPTKFYKKEVEVSVSGKIIASEEAN